MQISCEKCASEYVLDERLIPAGGAPVQCTRCGHIFVALPPAAQPARATTQMFGAAQPPPAEPPRSKTAMFGAVPPAQPPASEPPRSKTAMFGAFSPPAQPPSRPPDGGPADPPRSKTAMFGAFTPPAQPPAGPPDASGSEPPRSKTAMFGAFTPPAQPPTGTPDAGGGEPPRSKTAMFGAFTPPAQPPTGTPDAGGGEPPRSKTAMFGAFTPPATTTEAATGEPPRSKTAMFGGFSAPASAPPPEAPSSDAPPRHTRTQIFGKAPTYGDAARAPAEPSAPGSPDYGTVDDDSSYPAEDEQVAAEGDGDFEDQLLPGSDEGDSAPAEPAPVPLSRPAAKVELPPENASASAPAVAPSRSRRPPAASAPVATSGGGRTVGVLLTVALVAAAAFLSYRVYEKRKNAVPSEAIAAHDQATRLIRRDDEKARQQALQQLAPVAENQTQFVEPRATVLAATAFELDELKARVARREAEIAALQRRVDRLMQEQTPEDWQNRVEAAKAEIDSLRSELSPVQSRLAEASERALNAATALDASAPSTPAAQRAVLGARAVYAAVVGSDEAIALSNQYATGGPAEGWGSLAFAEYALNTRVPPDTLREALSGLEGLRSSDPGFFRASVLAGRLALALGDYEQAITALESVTALNPDHTFARTVLSWAQEEQRERGG